MMIGVRNMIEAADLRVGDQVLLLADTRSDKPNAGLRFFGAEPMILVIEPIAATGMCRTPSSKPCASQTCYLGVAGLYHLYPCASRHGTKARGERQPTP
jgi:hypothetical protein